GPRRWLRVERGATLGRGLQRAACAGGLLFTRLRRRSVREHRCQQHTGSGRISADDRAGLVQCRSIYRGRYTRGNRAGIIGRRRPFLDGRHRRLLLGKGKRGTDPRAQQLSPGGYRLVVSERLEFGNPRLSLMAGHALAFWSCAAWRGATRKAQSARVAP